MKYLNYLRKCIIDLNLLWMESEFFDINRYSGEVGRIRTKLKNIANCKIYHIITLSNYSIFNFNTKELIPKSCVTPYIE